MVGVLPALRLRREPRRRVDRHAAARVPAVRRTSTTCIPTGRSRWRRAPTAERSSTSSTVGTAAMIVWVPWQRPGFELALMLREAVRGSNPGCDGIILGGHGLFTWGNTQRECYLSSVKTIDQMGEFVEAHAREARGSGRAPSAGPAVTGTVADRESAVAAILPHLRGAVSSNRRVVGHFDSSADALAVRELGVGRRAVRDGHELSGPLSPHAHLADVRAVGSRHGDTLAALQERIADADRQVPRGLRRATTSRSRSPTRRRCATATRRSSSFRGSACSGSARTSARRASRPSSSSTPFT